MYFLAQDTPQNEITHTLPGVSQYFVYDLFSVLFYNLIHIRG